MRVFGEQRTARHNACRRIADTRNRSSYGRLGPVNAISKRPSPQGAAGDVIGVGAIEHQKPWIFGGPAMLERCRMPADCPRLLRRRGHSSGFGRRSSGRGNSSRARARTASQGGPGPPIYPRRPGRNNGHPLSTVMSSLLRGAITCPDARQRDIRAGWP